MTFSDVHFVLNLFTGCVVRLSSVSIRHFPLPHLHPFRLLSQKALHWVLDRPWEILLTVLDSRNPKIQMCEALVSSEIKDSPSKLGFSKQCLCMAEGNSLSLLLYGDLITSSRFQPLRWSQWRANLGGHTQTMADCIPHWAIIYFLAPRDAPGSSCSSLLSGLKPVISLESTASWEWYLEAKAGVSNCAWY